VAGTDANIAPREVQAGIGIANRSDLGDPITRADVLEARKAIYSTSAAQLQVAALDSVAVGKPSLPQKLWNPADAVQPAIDLFNQGNIVEATKKLKELQDEAPSRETGAWRHEIEVLNSKVDFSKLNMKDVAQIMGVDRSGNLITASADLLSEQTRIPGASQKAQNEFALWRPDINSGQLVSFDPDGTAQIDRVSQYKRDLEAARALYVRPDQMRIRDDITPIVDAFKAGDYATGTAKLKALQDADKPQEKQMWLRHIEAVNANLDFSKLGLQDVGQIMGVDQSGNLITASADLSKEQTRIPTAPQKVQSEFPFLQTAPYYSQFVSMDPDGAAQIATVKDITQEAEEARLSKLGPGMHRISFTADGEQREADVYVGAHVDPTKPAPVAYVLHGAGPPPERGVMEGETQADKWADDKNAIVVYGMAEEHTQPVGNLAGIVGALDFLKPDMDYHAWQAIPNSGLNETRLSYDDVHYLKALDSIVSDKTNVDQHRKVIFTFSDGATVAKNGAVEIGASAVIEVHGGIKNDYQLPADAGIAYFAVNGEADQVLPRAGASVYDGFWGNWEARWPKMANSDPTRDFDDFALANGCSGSPIVTRTPGEIRSEFRADQCTTGSPVVEIDRPNDGHVVDNPHPSFFNYAFGIFLGQKDTSYDAFRATVDEALRYPKDNS